jgi:hypothetical protein
MYTTSLRLSDPTYSLDHTSKYVPREASSCDSFVIVPYSNGYTDLRLRTAKNMFILILASWKEPLQTKSRRIEAVETSSRLLPKPSDQSHQRILSRHDETGMLASGRRRDREHLQLISICTSACSASKSVQGYEDNLYSLLS